MKQHCLSTMLRKYICHNHFGNQPKPFWQPAKREMANPKQKLLLARTEMATDQNRNGKTPTPFWKSNKPVRNMQQTSLKSLTNQLDKSNKPVRKV